MQFASSYIHHNGRKFLIRSVSTKMNDIAFTPKLPKYNPKTYKENANNEDQIKHLIPENLNFNPNCTFLFTDPSQ